MIVGRSGLYRDARCGLAHARLSIIDLASGQQPLCNEDETKKLARFCNVRGHMNPELVGKDPAWIAEQAGFAAITMGGYSSTATLLGQPSQANLAAGVGGSLDRLA